MELTRNHFAVVSVWTTAPRSGVDWACTALPSGILLVPPRLVDAANEVHNVSHVLIAQSVIDPCGHGGTLYPVEDRFEQALIGCLLHEPRVPQIARVRRNVERVRP